MSTTTTPTVDGFFDPRTQTVTYLVHDPASRSAVVIDPVLDFDPRSGRLWTESVDRVLTLAEAKRLTIERVLETHPHADHLSGAQTIALRTGARVGAGARITETLAEFAPRFGAGDVALDGSGFDDLYADDEVFGVGGLRVRVLSTPGHTPACVTYLIGDAAFVGDLVFMPDFGTPRCDFPGGCARTLYRSIARILALPPKTRFFVGHDYPSGAGRTEPAWETDVATQRRDNKHLLAVADEDGFYALRRARDAGLDPPTLLLAALQVNIRAGHMPPPDTDGRVYLRLPVSGPDRSEQIGDAPGMAHAPGRPVVRSAGPE